MPMTAQHHDRNHENVRRHVEAKRRALVALRARHEQEYLLLLFNAKAEVEAERGPLPSR